MAESARTARESMTHETAVLRASDIADRVLAPAASQNDKAGWFSTEAVDSLGQAGLLGLMLPAEAGGAGLGPRTFAAVTATIAEADASVAMVYVMHVLGAAAISAARPGAATATVLSEIAAGRHLSTLAISEAGSRSHFWAPLSRPRRNGKGVCLTASKSWVTSAGHAQSYIVSSLSPEGSNPSDLNFYMVPADAPGLTVAGLWDGLGLRANASAPMKLAECEIPFELQITEEWLPGNDECGAAAILFGQCNGGIGPLPRRRSIYDGTSQKSSLRTSEPESGRELADSARAARSYADRHRRPCGPDR